MIRLTRKFTLILCALCVAVFLFLYLLINYSVPADKQRNGYNLENKIKELENGLQLHQQEMGHLKKKLETFQRNKNNVESEEEDLKKERHLKHPKFPPPQLNRKEMFKEMVISAEDNYQCDINVDPQTQAQIQMLELYKNISFDNDDGGVWKQGWNIKYDPLQYNEHHKLKVFVVPHSHNDPGWLKTFDAYYEHNTKHILSNMLRHLKENPDMKFIWAEISYFSRFFEGLGLNSKQEIRKLVKSRQLDFVTGGWVMTDEANSHWLSILMQLTEGHSWLKTHLNVTPKTSWSIDPFGYSPTMPYILKNSGFKNLLIQRTHYSVKKRLAKMKELEFRWRQVWDVSGRTELFTHMMPFYSYDVPHTCGPDPKICCQFDFKRIPSFGLNLLCPWRVNPQQIVEQNVAQKAELILDQWRKKAELFRTNSVLIPLGDDFRFSQSTEWEAQMRNYEMIFDYINKERKMFAEAKFATLQEYFDSVHREQELASFPTLSGDFFTYADRDDHYWSGYYTSRPYHKRMDRVLLHHIRSAEMLHAWNHWEPTVKFDEMLENARRELSLFQHHDGITGTAKTHVVLDYANRMLNAVKDCRFVMQQAVYRLMTKASIYIPDFKFTYFYYDDSRWPGPDDGRTTIILGMELPTKYVVFHNSLPQWREELVELYVSKPFISVRDFDNKAIPAQISPVWSWHGQHDSGTVLPQASTTKYRLMFKVNIPPLGLVTYIIQSEPGETMPESTALAKNLILTVSPYSINLGDYPDQVKFAEPRDISLHVGEGPTVAFHGNGLLKSIQIDESSPHTPTSLNFLRYGTRMSGAMSGAYLFLPFGEASPLPIINPVVLVQEGPLESSVTTCLPFAVHQTILRGGHPEIRNFVDIGTMDNTEIVMRIATHIQSDDTFYTDLNGLQMIKRKRLKKIPLQANYYPIPSSIFIEDDNMRLTVVSAQPLGGSSLKSGEIEIMQDRRLAQDDERGLGQGVLDNRPVLHIFRLVLEKIESCTKPAEEYHGGFLTSTAFNEYQSLLYPVDKFIWVENEWNGVERSFGEDHEQLENGVQIAVMRDLQMYVNKNIPKKRTRLNTGLVVHRTNLMECNADSHRSGVVNIKRLLNIPSDNNVNIYSTPLTFIGKKNDVTTDEINFCPMDTKAFIVQR